MNTRGAFVLRSLGSRWGQALFLKSCNFSCCSASPNAQLVQNNMMKKVQNEFIVPMRYYASKNKVKAGSKKKTVKFNENELREVINIQEMKSTMEIAVETMKDAFVKQLSIRSAGGSVESLKVEFEGDTYEMQEIAQITRKGQQTIIINMLTFPQLTKTVMDTLKKSNLNLNPQQDGTTIFVPVPKVTKEHREILAKKAKELFISCRDTVRKTQERYIKELKDGDFSDDVRSSATEQIKSMGDYYAGQAEDMMKTKKDELLGL